jgi:O-antigen ligase
MTGVAAVSGVVYGGFGSGYPGAGITILFNLFLFPAVVFSVVVRTTIARKQLSVLCFILTLFGLYLALTAILERTPLSWLVFPRTVVDPLIVQHWGRSRGPFLQAEFNGTVMAQLVPIALLLSGLSRRGRRMLGVTTAALLCLGIFLTGTRAALASLFIVFVLGAAMRNGQRRLNLSLFTSMVASIAVAYVLWGMVLPRLSEIEPLSDRLKLLAVTFEMISDYPVTGIGYGRFDLMQDKFFDYRTVIVSKFTDGSLWPGGTHNTLLTIFAELGIIPGTLFLLLLARPAYYGFKLSRLHRPKEENPEAGYVFVCSLLVCIVFVINALAVELRYTLTPNGLFWIFAAVLERHPGKVM